MKIDKGFKNQNIALTTKCFLNLTNCNDCFKKNFNFKEFEGNSLNKCFFL